MRIYTCSTGYRESLETGYTMTSSIYSAGGLAGPVKKSVTVPEIQTSTQNASDWTWPSTDPDRVNSPEKLHPDYEPEDEFRDTTTSTSTTSSSSLSSSSIDTSSESYPRVEGSASNVS